MSETTETMTASGYASRYGANARDLLDRWDGGRSVWSCEMGGMGPGYEQAIQIMAFEMIRYMLANVPDWDAMEDDKNAEKAGAAKPFELRYWTKYRDAMDKVLFADGAPCKLLQPSGAQYGAASNLAMVIIRRGPVDAFTDPEIKDRLIQVRKEFPSMPPASAPTAQPVDEGLRIAAAARAIWLSNGGIERIWDEGQSAPQGSNLANEVATCFRQARAVLASLEP